MSGPVSGELELWRRLRLEGDVSARDALLQAHVPWASAVARSIHARIRSYPVDRDDFVQNATIGLMEAMSRYEPERGIPFRAYAKPRVRGAVFNGLRAILGERTALNDDVARFQERLDSLSADHEAAGSDALSAMVESILGLGVGLLLEDAGRVGAAAADARDGFSFAYSDQLRTRLLSALHLLGERHRWIIEAHYFRFVPFTEIAQEFGVTKGRVSQLHSAALAELRRQLADI